MIKGADGTITNSNTYQHKRIAFNFISGLALLTCANQRQQVTIYLDARTIVKSKWLTVTVAHSIKFLTQSDVGNNDGHNNNKVQSILI